MPSWFYGEKWVDYGICKVSVCPQTPPKGILRQHFHYDDSLMYVCDCGWYKLCMTESVVLGKVSISMAKTWVSKYPIWRLCNMPMTMSMTYNLLPNDDSTAPQFVWHALLSLYGHEASFIRIIQHVMLCIFMCSLLKKAPLWQCCCGSTIIEAPEQRSTLKVGFYASVYNTETIRM